MNYKIQSDYTYLSTFFTIAVQDSTTYITKYSLVTTYTGLQHLFEQYLCENPVHVDWVNSEYLCNKYVCTSARKKKKLSTDTFKLKFKNFAALLEEEVSTA